MVDRPESDATERAKRVGVAYAVAAAAMAAIFLFLPIAMLGYTMSVVAAVAAGEPVAWTSTVGMSLALVGIPALASLVLLFIPLLLLQAAARRLGASRASSWVGGLLSAALSGVALLWFLDAQSSRVPDFWYAAAFGAAALVILIASSLVARRRTGNRSEA
jgi:hypothetical protein